MSPSTPTTNGTTPDTRVTFDSFQLLQLLRAVFVNNRWCHPRNIIVEERARTIPVDVTDRQGQNPNADTPQGWYSSTDLLTEKANSKGLWEW